MTRAITKFLPKAPANSIMGNNTGSEADIDFLSVAEAQTLLEISGGGGGEMFLPTELNLTQTSGGSYTISKGLTPIATTSISTATSFNSTIGSVTDITDPATSGGWTNIVNLTSGPYMIQPDANSNGAITSTKINSDEPNDKALRLQILIDGTIVADYTNTSNGVLCTTMVKCFRAYTFIAVPFFCNSSFLIRMARDSDFTSSVSSHLTVYPMAYMKGTLT